MTKSTNTHGSLEAILSPFDNQRNLTPHIFREVERLAGHRPVIAMFGKTGAGKSSLGNSLFGRELYPVSHVRSGTREPKLISQTMFGVEVDLIDFPGIAESGTDEQYRNICKEWAPKVDVVLWAVSIDDRALQPDVVFLSEIVKVCSFPLDRIVFALSQVEKASPLRDWNVNTNEPGPIQAETIAAKMAYVAELFSSSQENIVPVSADERYGLEALALRLIKASPNHAALNLSRALSPELRTEEVKAEVKSKLWDQLKKFVNDNEKLILTIIGAIVTGLLSRGSKKL